MENFEVVIENNFNRIKDKIKKLKAEEKKIVFYSKDDDLNLKVIEKLDIDFLIVSLSENERKDFMKQRNSGFNEVMGKICNKKGIQLGFDFKEILNSKIKELILSRLKQNIEICKRLKIQIKFFNTEGKNEKDLRSFGIVLGMPTWMIKDLI